MRFKPIKRRFGRLLALMFVCAPAMPSLGRADSPAPRTNVEHAAKMARGLEIFKEHVRPILLARCFRCHGGKSTEAEFSLTDREDALRGGQSGPAIVPGFAGRSLLYQLVTH